MEPLKVSCFLLRMDAYKFLYKLLLLWIGVEFREKILNRDSSW